MLHRETAEEVYEVYEIFSGDYITLVGRCRCHSFREPTIMKCMKRYEAREAILIKEGRSK